MAEPRNPVSIPGYTLGTEAKPRHFTADISWSTAAEEADWLSVGDAAFILRSGYKWSYAILAERIVCKGESDEILRFDVGSDNRKSIPKRVWGKYIRTVKIHEDESAWLEEQKAANIVEETASQVEEEDCAKAAEALKEQVACIDTKEDAGEGTSEERSEAVSSRVSSFVSVTTKPAETPSGEAKAVDASKEDNARKETREEIDVSKEDTARTETREEMKTKEESRATTWARYACGVSSMVACFVGDKSNKREESMATAAPKKEMAQTKAGEARDDAEDQSPQQPSITLLQTPITFYKASTMQKDPAVAALEATSFADEQVHDSLKNEGVVVCEMDPLSASIAERLKQERIYGDLTKQGVVVVDTLAALRKPDGSIVEFDKWDGLELLSPMSSSAVGPELWSPMSAVTIEAAPSIVTVEAE